MNLDFLDMCGSDLIVPVTEVVCLSNVVASKKNNKSVTFIFKHPDDVSNSEEIHESILWTYTMGAKLNPTAYIDRDGNKKRKAFALGQIQLISLLDAFGVEDIPKWLGFDRDTLAEECKSFIGLCVTCPRTGIVKGNDKVDRVAFKFPLLDFEDEETFTLSLNDNRECFGPSDLDLKIHLEGVRKRATRREDAVTPIGEEDGDSII